MDPGVADVEHTSPNVIAVHLDITAPQPSSIVVTGRNAPASDQNSVMALLKNNTSKFLSTDNGASRSRSASVGRDKKTDLRARYWAFLFENLQHAIDALYETCETDESISECKEVILVLENYVRDFNSLADWFRVKQDYENTPPPERPCSLAWEIRKSSPRKVFRRMARPRPGISASRDLMHEVNQIPIPEVTFPLTVTELPPVLANIPFDETSILTNPIVSAAEVVNEVPVEQIPDPILAPLFTDSYSQTDSVVVDSVIKRVVPVRKTSVTPTPPKKVTKAPTPVAKRPTITRKPVPGRNIAAPVFVPGKKITLNCAKDVDTKKKPVTDDDLKSKLPRSRSDTSAFETIKNNISSSKSYTSADNVAKVEESSSSSQNSMEVIHEGKNATVENLHDMNSSSQGINSASYGVDDDAQKCEQAESVNTVIPEEEHINHSKNSVSQQKSLENTDSCENIGASTPVVGSIDPSKSSAVESVISAQELNSENVKPFTDGINEPESETIPDEPKIVSVTCAKSTDEDVKPLNPEIVPVVATENINKPRTEVIAAASIELTTESVNKSETEIINIGASPTKTSTDNSNELKTEIVHATSVKVTRNVNKLKTEIPAAGTKVITENVNKPKNEIVPEPSGRSITNGFNKPKIEKVVANGSKSAIECVHKPKTEIVPVTDSKPVDKPKTEIIPKKVVTKPPATKLRVVRNVTNENGKTDKRLNGRIIFNRNLNSSKSGKSVVCNSVKLENSVVDSAENSKKMCVKDDAAASEKTKVSNQYVKESKNDSHSILNAFMEPNKTTNALESGKINNHQQNKSDGVNSKCNVQSLTADNTSMVNANVTDGNINGNKKQTEITNSSEPNRQNLNQSIGVPKLTNIAHTNVKRKPLSPIVINKPQFSTPKPVIINEYKNGYSRATKSASNRPINRQVNSSGMIRSKTAIDMKPNRASEKEQLKSRKPLKDVDGWETVTSRSRRSLASSKTNYDVNKRFHEPTPSSSLPTLAVLEKEKTPDRAKMKKEGRNRSEKPSPASSTSGLSDKSRSERKRNRNNSHNSAENEQKNYKLNKERPIISSTAMFTTIQPKKKKAGNKERRKSVKEAHRDWLDAESLRKSEELHEREISLQNEISKLQCEEIDDSDKEMEELSENLKNSTERRTYLEKKYGAVLARMSWAEQVETLDRLEELLVKDPSGCSLKYAKNFTSLEQLEDLVIRLPGRALELHQKLSLPSRKRTSPDRTILQHNARQAKAEKNREQLLQDKSAKVRELFNKVAEVKAQQAQLTDERRKLIVEKLKRAEENRNLHLKNIQDKAHDEAIKQKEIAFINELEAQNKRQEFYALRQEQEDRLQSILEERQRRHEEKAAKDAAVEERRKAIEAERQEKIEELQERMRKREERIDREQQEKERERLKIAREKARDREDRLLALQAAQLANVEELQKKIQQKQEDSARRHEENIEQIRQRAIDIGTPRLTPYQINKLCSICNVVIDSEVFLLSHLKGRSHQESVKKYRSQFEDNVKFIESSIITDAPADILDEKRSREKERQKALRKKCKKIRHRLITRSGTYMNNIVLEVDKTKKNNLTDKGRILKSIKDIDKLVSSQDTGSWPNNRVSMLERSLFETLRALKQPNKCHQDMFRDAGGFSVLSKIYDLALDLPKNMSPYLPLKCFVVTSNVYLSACENHIGNSTYILLSNNIVQILDLLLNRLNLMIPNSEDGRNGMVVYKADSVADVLMKLYADILSCVLPTITELKNERDNVVSQHIHDIVSYTVCTGIVDKIAIYCSSVHDNKSADSYFLLRCIQLLTRLVESRRDKMNKAEDYTQLTTTLKATELVGAVSMLYGILLHRDSMSTHNEPAAISLPEDAVAVVTATMRLFGEVARLDIPSFQNIMGAEGISLQVRHIISYLLKFCTQIDGNKELLHEVIVFIGYFAVHHYDNQMILQSGSTPTVLQQLLSLPFSYFCNPDLSRILFPTLLACCIDNAQNRELLEQELSFQSLEDFKNSPDAKDISLIKLL